MSNLIPIENVNAGELFASPESLDALLNQIETEARSLVPDLSTAAGRKQVASVAHKVSRSKVVIDNAGKGLVKGWKERAKAVDSARKTARDRLDTLRDQVRAPLTEWEAEQERLKAAEQLKQEIIGCWDEAHEMNALFDDRLALQREREELERKDREDRERREREEREARIAREAEERTRREEREKHEAAERARIEKEAREKAEREAEERRKQEEAERLAREEEARKADIEHRRKVNRAAVEGFMQFGLVREDAVRAVKWILDGNIPNVTINY